MKTAFRVLSVTVIAVIMSRVGRADSVVADKVVVTNTGATTAFHISEVEVFEQGTATNVAASAAGATATASSTGWGTQASWANDGGTDGAFGSNSIWHDMDGQAGDDPLQLDQLTILFNGPKTVDLFDLWGRTDCCTERDDSIQVSFYNGAELVALNDTGIITDGTTGRVAISKVPEPTTAALLIAGCAALAGRCRRGRA